MLHWHSNYDQSKFFVKGTELATAIVPGTLSRYQLCEIRCYDANKQADRCYALRDAATISDAEVMEGKRPNIVAWFDFEDDALEAVMQKMQLEHNF